MNKINYERLNISASQMHDVRNYIQSLSQTIENLSNLKILKHGHEYTQNNQNISKSQSRLESSVKKSAEHTNSADNKINLTSSLSDAKDEKSLKFNQDSENSKINEDNENSYKIIDDTENTYKTINETEITNKINYDTENTSKTINDTENTGKTINLTDNDSSNPKKQPTSILKQNIKSYEDKIQEKMKTKALSDNRINDKTFIMTANKIQFTNLDKNFELNLDMSFDNKSILNDQIEEYEIPIDHPNIYSSFKESDKQSDIIPDRTQNKNNQQNEEITKLIDYSRDPIEMFNIIKFINQKVNFLQHIDLTFEECYTIKLIETSPGDLLSQFSKIMKILFINKNNEITLTIDSKINKIKVDIHMLKYLICQIGLNLHQKNTNINIQVLFDETIYENCLSINIRATGINLDNRDNSNRFDQQSIFVNIIRNLGQNILQTQKYDDFDNLHCLDISYYTSDDSTTQNLIKVQPDTPINDISLIFNEKVHIKNDKATSLKHSNVLIYNNTQIEIKNGFIFINIDDEINIKSMNTALFNKQNISLLCCSNDHELKIMMVQVQSQYILSQNKPQIVILLDHVLDGDLGIDVYKSLRNTQERFNLSIIWVLLSSTEDQETIGNQKRNGIEYIIDKPLTKLKIEELFNYLNQVETD